MRGLFVLRFKGSSKNSRVSFSCGRTEIRWYVRSRWQGTHIEPETDMNDTPQSRIARDLDSGAVFSAVRSILARGEEVTCLRVSQETGIPTHRVEPHLREMVR